MAEFHCSTSQCSGHGLCNYYYACECDIGWSSQGHFIYTTGLYCDQDMSAIYVISFFNLVVHLLAFVFLCRALYCRIGTLNILHPLVLCPLTFLLSLLHFIPYDVFNPLKNMWLENRQLSLIL